EDRGSKIEDRGSKIDLARAGGENVSEESSQAVSHHSPLSSHHSRSPTGMLWESGPTVFPGYIGYDGPPPFEERDGRRWYVSGDLAELDADGFIRLLGRLKRFLKAGGEMISLPALEEPFTRRYPAGEEGPRVAVEG